MILYRLSEDISGMHGGSCISEEKYKSVKWFNKCLYEAIFDLDRKEMIEHEDKEYCEENGIECLLFYSQDELEKFMKKIYDFSVD